MNRFLPTSLSAVAACALSSAMALELPQRKPGMWENDIKQSADGKVTVTKGCRTAADLAHAKEAGDAFVKKSCSKFEVRKDGGKWITDMVCKAGAGTMTSHGESTIGDGVYHSETTTTFDPPSKDRARMITINDGKFLGPC